MSKNTRFFATLRMTAVLRSECQPPRAEIPVSAPTFGDHAAIATIGYSSRIAGHFAFVDGVSKQADERSTRGIRANQTRVSTEG